MVSLYIHHRTLSIFRISLYCLILCSSLSATRAHGVTILSPASTGQQKIYIQTRRPQSTLILRLESRGERAELRVATARKRTGEEQVIDAMGIHEKNSVLYAHYTLPLKKGRNRFVISPGKIELTIHYQPVRTLLKIDFEAEKNFLFHRQAVIPRECKQCHSEQLPDDAGLDVKRLQKNGDYSPACFSCHRKLLGQNTWLHGPSANVYCMSCHRKGIGNTRITMLTGQVDEVCFQCHVNKRKIKNRKHIHGPVGTGDCTICHDPHGDDYKFQLWADGQSDLCIGCHGDKKNSSKKSIGYYPHGIILGGGCIACHSPHATNYRFQLYKPINELCVSCHNALANMDKGHPVGSHPMKGKDDPRREGRELSCTSCHSPHGSNFRFLLIGDILGGHVCNKCHNNDK